MKRIGVFTILPERVRFVSTVVLKRTRLCARSGCCWLLAACDWGICVPPLGDLIDEALFGVVVCGMTLCVLAPVVLCGTIMTRGR